MDNINGALAFKATLDINDFNVSAQAMERSIKQVSSTAVSESSVMDNSIQSFAQNGAKYIVSYLVGQGMGTLLQSIVQTRGQFQQLEIAFTTMLKSGTQAKGLMDRLIDTAAKTPFDLSGIASSAKQMLAYGSTVDNVVDELVMLVTWLRAWVRHYRILSTSMERYGHKAGHLPWILGSLPGVVFPSMRNWLKCLA